MVATYGRSGGPQYYLDSQQTLHGPRHGADGSREAQGAWWNPGGMFSLPDGDPVEPEAFRNLHRGRSPDGLTGLARRFRGQRRGGTDLVFAADKSVSALWALADPAMGRQIEEAHDAAVRVALDEIVAKRASWAVSRRNGGREFGAAKVLGATFRHGCSRQGDPHLHTHGVIFNLAWSFDDGICRSLESRPLHSWMKAAASVYRHALAWGLGERLGIRCERYGRNGAYARVAGMPFGLVRDWSKRMRAMRAAMEDAGMRARGASPSQIEAIARKTRDGRAEPHPALENLVPVWMREQRAHVADPARLIASLPEPDRSDARFREILHNLEHLPEKLVAGRFVFSYPLVVEEVCNATAGYMDWSSAETWTANIVSRPEVVRVDDPERSPAARAGQEGLQIYRLRATPGLEEEVRQAVRELNADGRFHVPRPDVEDRIGALLEAGYPLDDDHIAAIRRCTSSSRVAAIEFAPAMDRSLVLRPVRDLYREHGYQVIGTASTLRAAAELYNESGIAAVQVGRFLRMGRNGAIDKDRPLVLAVADAGILDAREIGILLEFSERHLAKILLVATSGQRPRLAVSPAFDLVTAAAGQQHVGAATHWRTDAGRTWRRTADGAGRGGEVAEGLPRVTILPDVAVAGQLAQTPSARVRLCAGLGEAIARMVDEWDRVRRAGPGDAVAVVVRTRNEEQVLNHVFRARLLAGSADGPRVRMHVHCRTGMEYGTAVPIEVKAGDWLRLGATLWEKRLLNGSVVVVEDIALVPSGSKEPRYLLRVRTEAGRREEFFHDEVRDHRGGIRLGHGYVSTVANAIGRFDRLLVLADDRWHIEQFERAAFCCRGEIDVHVNRELLSAALCPVGATNDPRSAVDDSRILDHLRRCWSARRGSVHPEKSVRPEVSRLYPDGCATAVRWVSANDGGDGSLQRLARNITCAELDLRHGETVAAFAGGRNEVLAEWSRCRERIAVEGDSALLSPSVGNTIRRHEELLDLARSLPLLWGTGMADLLAKRGNLKAGDVREFHDLYRRMRTDRWIAARKSGRRKLAGDNADVRTDVSRKERDVSHDAKLVETYLAEVGRCREFRRFTLDVAARQDRPVEELASWAESLADYDRMIARGREMLSGELVASGLPRAEDTDMAAVRTAVETLEEERHQGLSGPDRRSDDENVCERRCPLHAGTDEAHLAQRNSAGQGRSFSW